jgi:CRP-like cAMP-binding protein
MGASVAAEDVRDSSNGILSALSDDEIARVAPHLRRTDLAHKSVLYDAGQTLSEVLFVERGMVSLLSVIPRGALVEIAVVGCEGMCGMALFHRVPVSADRAIVQAAGSAYSMDATTFAGVIDELPAMSAGLHSFAYALQALTSQTSACNRRHQSAQRLARWLLLAHDRIADDEMPLTHEFLGHMLGLRRSTVTVVADELRRAGAIRYTRGKVTIVDRAKLGELSCDCYRAIAAAFSNADVRTARDARAVR